MCFPGFATRAAVPLNLAMPEALLLQNQTVEGEAMSVLEAAEALGVSVVASASILQGRVARGIPEAVREPLGSLATDAQTAIQFVRSAPGITTALVGEPVNLFMYNNTIANSPIANSWS